MTGPDAFDDTAADYERLETELLAQDRDAVRVSTADVDKTTARQLVSDLLNDGVVTAVADQRVLLDLDSATTDDPDDTGRSVIWHPQDIHEQSYTP